MSGIGEVEKHAKNTGGIGNSKSKNDVFIFFCAMASHEMMMIFLNNFVPVLQNNV